MTTAAGAALLAVLASANAAPQLPSEAPPAAGGASVSLPLTQALDRAVAEGWHALHIETECATEDGLRTTEVFASGVGILDRKTQFQLGRAEVRALLEAFREARFPDMRESYGGRRDPVAEEKQAPRATCRVGLRLDGLGKRVVQLQHGRQSEELRRLADRILLACEQGARSGRSAASLEDGLAKVATGELAAESFHVLVHRKLEGDEEDARTAEGWLLRVDGRQASTQRHVRERGYAEPVALELSSDQLGGLATLLREKSVAELPVNLHAEHYTELVVSVLNRRKAVQARPFVGMTRTTHGENQKRFDEILARLQDLERQVGTSGRPASSETR